MGLALPTGAPLRCLTFGHMWMLEREGAAPVEVEPLEPRGNYRTHERRRRDFYCQRCRRRTSVLERVRP